MRPIEIDDQVWARIKSEAEPLVDDANSVLRRLLGVDGDAMAPSGRLPAAQSSRRSKRAPLGSLIDKSAFELPILRELAERGGVGAARDITEAVGERVAGSLTDRDYETLESGSVRWVTRVQFTRLRLKERGLLRADSKRGVWELTEKGREAAERGNARVA